ncbi:helix-turn-helix domain-containing protein [Gluconobacter frateurii]|nr:helix-turn-helix transcriptional regulator [Gluconobacter frateurii]
MTLDEYRRQEGVTVSDLADAIGVTGRHRIRTVYRYLTQERTPALPVIRRIAEFTNGQVTFEDFLPARAKRPTKEPAHA